MLLRADIISSTSLRTVPRLRKYYPDLISHDYGGSTMNPLLRMEEYVGCEGWVLIAIADTSALGIWKLEEQENSTLAHQNLCNRGGQIDSDIQEGLRGLEERCRKREGNIAAFYTTSPNQATQTKKPSKPQRPASGPTLHGSILA
ncbi:c6 transcription [Fusarium heterosporum]|uniref:C6 transcription n=1 Tax=Fusarium heterosporum TaxID=42747 RepID=A0A8H5SPW9_FUSHE|nr:c6 transcription [Fusarium heterosporum]